MCCMQLLFVFLISSNVEGVEQMELMHNFILDLIKTWKLLSPTIILEEDILNFCIKRDMLLCLVGDGGNSSEIAQHLNVIGGGRYLDGLIFVGTQVHEQLLMQMVEVIPTIFTSNCPVFMPAEYSNLMKLRLDSNIVFYQEMTSERYELVDEFAVKGGSPIIVKFGEWNKIQGITLTNSMYRWERRTDLMGATFINGAIALALKKDKDGKIVGSEGYFQDKLFHMTDRGSFTYDICNTSFIGLSLLSLYSFSI